MIILGLDVSTTTIGMNVSVVDEDRNVMPIVVDHLSLKTPKEIKESDALYYKSDMFKSKIQDYKQYEIDTIVIEEPLLGSNNVRTVGVLMKFNGIISYICKEEFGISPEYISSMEAREFGMPQLKAVRKFNKKGHFYSYNHIKNDIKNENLPMFGSYPIDCNKKDIVWNFISEKYPNIKWIYNKKGELAKENFDASDSLICSIGYVNKTKYNGTKPQVIDYEEILSKKSIIMKYHNTFCGKVFEREIELTIDELKETPEVEKENKVILNKIAQCN